MTAWVTGVKKLTKLPSGSRNSNDRLPPGIVAAAGTSAALIVGAVIEDHEPFGPYNVLIHG
jgi:hypothetical protein